MNGKIFDIKRFAVHDGNGIRTTVFLKGCPLKCVWCHNPESITVKEQLAYYGHKCVHCGSCVPVCQEGAHTIGPEGHVFQRKKCLVCGACVPECLGGALTLYGREVSVEELLPQLLEDRDFYETSGGGVTLSGGECLRQGDFCAELLKSLKKEGINTAVDTCGFVPRETLDKVMPYTDMFLFDVKAMDEEVHVRCTGRPNGLILENLRYLDQCGKAIEVRVPYVPGWNHDQMEKIAAFLKPLKHVVAVKVLAYHNYAGSKYDALGAENTMPAVLPTEAEIQKAQALFDRV